MRKSKESHDGLLKVKWQTDDLVDRGCYGAFILERIQVRVIVDPRLSELEKATTMVHEMIEMLDRIHGVGIKHDEIDLLAKPLAWMMLDGGFSPEKLLNPDADQGNV